MAMFGNSIAGQGSKFDFVDPKQSDANYNGLPNGKYLFVIGFGWEQTLAKKESYAEQHLLKSQESDVIIPYNKCQLVVKVGQEKKWLTWHFTGENDPMVSLGYAQKNGYATERTKEQVTRLNQINGFSAGFNTYHEFVEARFHVPMWRIELNDDDEPDLKTMKPVILSLTNGQLKNILTSFKALEMEKNRNPFGYLLMLVKDKSKGKDAYQWTTIAKYNVVTSDNKQQLIEEAKEVIAWNAEKLMKIFTEANGGEINSENVWTYITTVLATSRQEVDKNLNIRISSNLVEVETVDLGGSSTEDALAEFA